MNEAGQTTETDAYFNLTGVTYSTSSVHLGTSGTNYYPTLYGYDVNGNQDRVEDPTGTITRTVYDGQNRAISTWTGTDDTPTSGDWSPTNNTGSSNMVETSANVYDNGGVGDGLVTESVQFPGGGAPARATQTLYDWRDRQVSQKQGIPISSLVIPYNLQGIYADGVDFPSDAGITSLGSALSANLLGSSQSWDGANYAIGATGNDNVVQAAGQVIPLPSGSYDSLGILATSINGNQTGQTFTITYTDASTQTITQSISDWHTPQGYSGETTAINMGYYDTDLGGTNATSTNIYGYSFDLNPAKTVQSITLPNNSNVVILAIDSYGPAVPPAAINASLTYNEEGIAADGMTFPSNGGIDGGGSALSGNLLGTSQTWNGAQYTIGAPGSNNVVAAEGQTLTLPSGNYSSLNFLGTGVNGNQPDQTFTITYTDATTQTFTQSLSDWHTPQGYSGESIAVPMPYRDKYLGGEQFLSFNVYGYSVNLDPTKTVESITLPNNSNVTLLAIDLQPPMASSQVGTQPLTVSTLDNLGDPTANSQYDGTTIAMTDANADGVPDDLDASKLTAYSTVAYDDQGRTYQTQQYSVDPITGSISSTALTSQTFFDPDGQTVAQSTPQGMWSKTAYDGAGRAISQFTTDGGVVNSATPGYATASSVTNDVVLSETDTTYDSDGNAIETTESDRLPTATTSATGALTSSDARINYSASYFDAASRDIADENVGTNGGTAWTRPTSPDSSDDMHLVTTIAYNAMGLTQDVTDPRGIDARAFYDALGRTSESIADYTNGTPTDNSNQTTAFTYDGDGNTLTQTAVEPSGTPNQTTAYVYGTTSTSGIFSNTLLSKVEYPDATAGTASTSASNGVSYTYDALGEKLTMTDQNGNAHAYSYDSLGRQTLDAVTTLGTGVNGSVMAIGTSYNAQGLPFQETSYSNAAATTVVNQDQDVYNGLGQMTGEYQSVSGPVTTSTTPEVQYAFSTPSTGSVQTSMTYPNGRVLDDVYNSGLDSAIGRVSGLADAGGSDAGSDQAYSYLGVGTIIGEVDGNGVTETATLDNFGRTSELKYVNSSSTTTDDFAYGYDRDGNVLYQNNLLNSAESQLYHPNSTTSGDDNTAYDGLNRLMSYEQGTLSASGNNGSTVDTVSSPTASQSWNLDTLGNQSTVTTNSTTIANTTNSKNELTANGSNSLVYDKDGNTLTDENGQTYSYDAWNRMMSAKNSGGTTLASYSNGPTGHRITETSGGTTTDIYFSNRWQDIEERQSGTVTRQDVWGLGYENQLVERDDNSTSGSLGISASGLGERLYAQQDLNWSVVSLLDASGNVVQRATFTPYGAVSFLTASWVSTSDAYGENVLFQGGRLETASGQYEFGYRDSDPQTGRWDEPDPSGYAGGANLYEANGDDPIDTTDPAGLRGQMTSPPVVTPSPVSTLGPIWNPEPPIGVQAAQAYLQGQLAVNIAQAFIGQPGYVPMSEFSYGYWRGALANDVQNGIINSSQATILMNQFGIDPTQTVPTPVIDKIAVMPNGRLSVVVASNDQGGPMQVLAPPPTLVWKQQLQAAMAQQQVLRAAQQANGGNLPIFHVYFSRTFWIAAHDLYAIAYDGQPDLLHYAGPGANQGNRPQALAPFPPAAMIWGYLNSQDEYPFASTQEGGAGASVWPVPRREQSLQGGDLSGFYAKNNLKKGCPFLVEVDP